MQGTKEVAWTITSITVKKAIWSVSAKASEQSDVDNEPRFALSWKSNEWRGVYDGGT